MSDPQQEYIDWFEKNGDAFYWLLSEKEQPRFARARGDVPIEVVDNLNEEQARLLCDKIQHRIAHGHYNRLYVRVLMRLNDSSAVDVLKTSRRVLKERQRLGIPTKGCNWKHEIALWSEAIRTLESSQSPLALRKPFRLSDLFGFLKRKQ